MNQRLVMCVVLAAFAALATGCGDDSGSPADVPDDLDLTGLVAFYEFDGDLADASGNGHHGVATVKSAFVADHNGAAASALHLDVNESFSVPDDDALDLAGAITVAAWIKADLSNFSYSCLVDKGYAVGAWSAGTQGSAVPIRKNLYLYVGSHTNSFSLNEAVPVGQDTWVHFVCCFDDTADTTAFYINGDHAFTQTAAAPVTFGATDLDLLVGNSHAGDGFAGAVDQLAIFGRVLSPAEVLELYEYD